MSGLRLVRHGLAIGVWLVCSLSFLCHGVGCDPRDSSLSVQMRPVQEVVLPERYSVMEMSDDGGVMALSTGFETIKGDNQRSFLVLLNTNNMVPITSPLLFDDWVSHVEFVSNDFGFLVGVSPDSSPIRVDTKEGQLQSRGSIYRVGLDGSTKVISGGLTVPFTSLAGSPNHMFAAVCSQAQFGEDAKCRFINLEDGRVMSVVSPPFTESLTATFSQDSQHGAILACGRNRPAVGRPGPTPDQENEQVLLVRIEDGQLIKKKVISSSYSGTEPPNVRSSTNAEEQHVSFGAHRSVASLAVEDGDVQVRELFNAGQVSGNSGFNVFDFDFDAVNKRIVFGDRYTGSHTGCTICFFDVRRKKMAKCGIERRDWPYQVRFSPDGRSLFALFQVKPNFKSVLVRYDLQNLSDCF